MDNVKELKIKKEKVKVCEDSDGLYDKLDESGDHLVLGAELHAAVTVYDSHGSAVDGADTACLLPSEKGGTSLEKKSTQTDNNTSETAKLSSPTSKVSNFLYMFF